MRNSNLNGDAHSAHTDQDISRKLKGRGFGVEPAPLLPTPNTTYAELIDALRPIRRRLRLRRALSGSVLALMVGALLGMSVMCLSFAFPLAHKWVLISGIGACVPLTALVCWLWPIDTMAVARAADEAGLEERAQTALLLSRNELTGFMVEKRQAEPSGAKPGGGQAGGPAGKASSRNPMHSAGAWAGRWPRRSHVVNYDFAPIVNLQRVDAIERLNQLAPKRAVKLQARRIPCCIAGGALLVLFALIFVPNPQDAVLAGRVRFNAQMETESQKLENYNDALAYAAEMPQSPETAAALRALSDELAARLREAADKRDALLALAEAEQRLSDLTARLDTARRQQTAAALNDAGLDELANALESDTQGALDEAAADAAASAASNAGEDALAQALADAAASLDDGNPDKLALQDAAQAIANDASQAESSSTATALSSLAAQLGGASASAAGSTSIGDLANLMSGIRASLGGSSARGGSGSGMGNGSGDSSDGDGSGAADGSGTGSSKGAGSGASSSGSTNLDAGYRESASSQSGVGNGSTSYKLGKYEEIYDPTRLGDGGAISQVTGEINEGDVIQTQLTPGEGDYSGSVPYNEVIGEYRESAYQAMRSADLPANVRQWVDDYFNALID